MNMLERMVFEPRRGMYRELEGLTTHFRPKDVALYRHLLPRQFAMPSQPIVTIFIADYVRVHSWPMTQYQEWSVLLKAECGGEAGWFSLTMPVTRWLPMVGGRYLGFPKYIADEITLVRSADACVAQAKYRNVTRLTLEFHSGVTRRLQPWEQELAENESFFKGDSFQLAPPGRGPRAKKISLRHVIPPKWSPESGIVRVRVHPDEIWKGIVPDETEFPGTYNHFVGAFNLIAERLC